MGQMVNSKFGLVSRTEARCLGDLERQLKAKKRRERQTKKKGAHDAKKL
ncbi:hypothetical protein [Levilactobacillus brevis]|nr:hypothetical protein [Levilactobacillus brevis]